MTKIKTLLFGILALMLVTFGAAAGRPGLEIYNGWLQGDMDVYGFNITNLGGIGFGLGVSNGVPLSQLSSGGATNTQVLTYNGTMWAPSNAPTGSSGSGSGFPLTSNGNLNGFGLTNGFFNGNGGGLTNVTAAGISNGASILVSNITATGNITGNVQSGIGIGINNFLNPSYLPYFDNSVLDVSGWDMWNTIEQSVPTTSVSNQFLTWFTNGMGIYYSNGFPAAGYHNIFITSDCLTGSDGANMPTLNTNLFVNGLSTLTAIVNLAKTYNEKINLYLTEGDTSPTPPGAGQGNNLFPGTNYIYQWTQWAMSNGVSGWQINSDNAGTSNLLYHRTFANLMNQAIVDYNVNYTSNGGANGTNLVQQFQVTQITAASSAGGSSSGPNWMTMYPDLFIDYAQIETQNQLLFANTNADGGENEYGNVNWSLSELNNPLLVFLHKWPNWTSTYMPVDNTLLFLERMNCSAMHFSITYCTNANTNLDFAWTRPLTLTGLGYATNAYLSPDFLSCLSDGAITKPTMNYTNTNTWIVSVPLLGTNTGSTMVWVINTNNVTTSTITVNVTNFNGLSNQPYYAHWYGNNLSYSNSFQNQFTITVASNSVTPFIIQPYVNGSNIWVGGQGGVFTANLHNWFYGALAGNPSVTGDYNDGFGEYALRFIGSGHENVAMGTSSLTSDTTGTGNTGVGYAALADNVSGFGNVGIGDSTLLNDTGGNNVGIGYNALVNITSGTGNVSVGYTAGSAFTGAESDNTDLNNVGIVGESHVARIGSPTTTNMTLYGQVNANGAGITNIVTTNITWTNQGYTYPTLTFNTYYTNLTGSMETVYLILTNTALASRVEIYPFRTTGAARTPLIFSQGGAVQVTNYINFNMKPNEWWAISNVVGSFAIQANELQIW